MDRALLPGITSRTPYFSIIRQLAAASIGSFAHSEHLCYLQVALASYGRNPIMRKVIAIEMVSLDGVIQGPGGTQEDTSNGFEYGGWVAHYGDEAVGKLVRRHMDIPFDLLVGRKTFDIWEPYWPKHADVWQQVNTATKYVASNTRTSSEWQPTVFLSGDAAEKVRQLKQQPGHDLHIYGSGDLLQTLLKHDLVDAFWLQIYPLTLGSGKKLFAGGAIPAAFKVAESQVTPNGIIIINYERAGALITRNFEES
jgi:dihydrofolate reductase